MGYAFLFRNYRADVGKWLSQDLIGYPDGWNNFAYCGNMPALVFDILGASWGNADFLYHYYNGGGGYVSTTTMGLNSQVLSVINGRPKSDYIDIINSQVSNNVKNAPQGYGYGTSFVTHSGGYDFGSIVWAMGGGTVYITGTVSYSWYEYTEDDSVFRDYSWSAYNVTYTYSDQFADPLDIGVEPGGIPYWYGDVWNNQYIPDGNGTVFIRNIDEEMEE